MASPVKESYLEGQPVFEIGLLETIEMHGDTDMNQATPKGPYGIDICNKDQIENVPTKNLKWSNMSVRQRKVLVLSVVAIFLTRFSYSILGPFYPLESAKKGMSTTVNGVVFGVFELVIFFLAPIWGTYLTRLGVKRTYVGGIILGGVCNIVFGTLSYLPDGTPFIVSSIICRATEAVGFSAFITAAYAIVSSEFEDNIGMVCGLLETGGGVGFVVGPVTGGALYDLGGFGFPFYFIGIVAIINAFVILKLLPTPKQLENKKRRSIFSLFRSLLAVLALLTTFLGVVGIATYNSTFAQHIHIFGFSTSISSLFFIISAGVFTVVAPLHGTLTQWGFEKPLIVAGLSVYGFSFLILGPSVIFPFISFEVWTACFGSALMGLSLGCSFIPTLKCMVDGATELGFEDNIDTFALVSGLFNSINCLGGAIGSMSGSALVDAFDYPIAYTAFGVFCISMGLVTFVCFSTRYFKRRGTKYDLNSKEVSSIAGIPVDRKQAPQEFAGGNTNQAFVLEVKSF